MDDEAVEFPATGEDPPQLPEDNLFRPWQVRAGRAEAAIEAFTDALAADPSDEAHALQWKQKLNPRSHVGARHHTVPRFLLERWADRTAQV